MDYRNLNPTLKKQLPASETKVGKAYSLHKDGSKPFIRVTKWDCWGNEYGTQTATIFEQFTVPIVFLETGEMVNLRADDKAYESDIVLAKQI